MFLVYKNEVVFFTNEVNGQDTPVELLCLCNYSCQSFKEGIKRICKSDPDILEIGGKYYIKSNNENINPLSNNIFFSVSESIIHSFSEETKHTKFILPVQKILKVNFFEFVSLSRLNPIQFSEENKSKIIDTSYVIYKALKLVIPALLKMKIYSLFDRRSMNIFLNSLYSLILSDRNNIENYTDSIRFIGENSFEALVPILVQNIDHIVVRKADCEIHLKKSVEDLISTVNSIGKIQQVLDLVVKLK